MVRETRHGAQSHVSFRYDLLGHRISKTGRIVRKDRQPARPLQEIQDAIPLTYVYTDQSSHEPLARTDGLTEPEIFWYHCHPNGMPERLTDEEGNLRWHGHNSVWGKLLREERLSGPGLAQNLRMQGQNLDRETGLHYNLFRYYDPDCGRFTQQDPIGLAGGLNLYQYAPNALGWVEPLGLSYIANTFKAQLRAAKRALKIPKNINNPGPVKVYDNKRENRTVRKHEVNGDAKYIVMYEEDTFGRGPHFHTADDLHGEPFESEVRYNQHPGHYSEEFKGIDKMKSRKKCR